MIAIARRLGPVGRTGGEPLALGFLAGEAERRHERLAVRRPVHAQQRRVDAADRARRLERPLDDLVEVDRAAELDERARAAGLLVGALERPADVARELVDTPVERPQIAARLVRPARRAAPTSSAARTTTTPAKPTQTPIRTGVTRLEALRIAAGRHAGC